MRKHTLPALLLSSMFSVACTNATVEEISPVAEKISVVFRCENASSISAVFSGDEVALTLSDQRKLVLSRAVSASGARYANSGESMVFWSKGKNAFFEENGRTTYKTCTEAIAALGATLVAADADFAHAPRLYRENRLQPL